MFNKTHTKDIQSLHHKKFRDEKGVFIAEGPKVVFELLTSGVFECQQVFAEEEWINNNALLLKKHTDITIFEIKDFELAKISVLTTPNKVLAVFNMLPEKEPDKLSGKITLVLDTLQDPGNFGTIIRTADWFGIKNIICSVGCADKYNPKVVQSTMGSLARVNIYYTKLEDWLVKYNHITKYAAALNGKPVSCLKNIEEAFIIIGNEGNGISEKVMHLCSEIITIPKKGKAESLNAAVATGIILAAINY